MEVDRGEEGYEDMRLPEVEVPVAAPAEQQLSEGGTSVQRARALEVERTRVMGEDDVVWLPCRVERRRDRSDETAEDEVPTGGVGATLVDVAVDVEEDEETWVGGSIMRDDTEEALLICADCGTWLRRVSALRGDCEGETISGGRRRGCCASELLSSAPAARLSLYFV
jgi:hypothetical protein